LKGFEMSLFATDPALTKHEWDMTAAQERIKALETALLGILDHPHISRNWGTAEVMTKARAILDAKGAPENAPDKITLHVERSKTGLYFVTSPNPRGLLIAAHTFEAALSEVPKALADLKKAKPFGPGLGR